MKDRVFYNSIQISSFNIYSTLGNKSSSLPVNEHGYSLFLFPGPTPKTSRRHTGLPAPPDQQQLCDMGQAEQPVPGDPDNRGLGSKGGVYEDDSPRPSVPLVLIPPAFPTEVLGLRGRTNGKAFSHRLRTSGEEGSCHPLPTHCLLVL